MSDRPGEMDERDVDARFASIVAAWQDAPAGTTDPADPSDPEVADRPARRDDREEAADAADESEGEQPDRPAERDPSSTARPPWVNPSPLDLVVPASSWRVTEPPADPAAAAAASDALDDDEHFEPPAVDLPPQEDLHFWGAVVGLVAGPLCLVYVAMARPFHSTRWFLAGLALSLLGFALLVLRQPHQRDEDDDGVRL